MIEKGKEESENVGRYQSILMSTIIAALLVWAAPEVIPILTNDEDGDIFTPDNVGDLATTDITTRISELFNLLLYIVRIAILGGIIIAVLMLQVDRPPERGHFTTRSCHMGLCHTSIQDQSSTAIQPQVFS